jgi:hypothetical protein
MSQSHAPPPAVPAPSAPQGYPPPPATPRQNGLAVASLVLGIVSLACSQCITALPGVILGHIALRQIRASGGTETGEGMAIGGLVCGYISIGITVLVVLVYVLFILLGLGAAAVSA